MGCGSCGTKEGGLPTGCKDHGSCKSGGCNRLNTHDWLSLLPVSDFSKPYPFVEVTFNHGSRKEFFKTHNPLHYEKGDMVTVEGSGGIDIGVVSLTGELVKLQMKKKGVSEKSEEIRRIIAKSTEAEIEKMDQAKKNEKEMMIRARVIARDLRLDMKIAEVEMQADGKKATFFYTAEDRVDFRELIKRFAADFRVKIEMRQIGIRQEAAKVGGIGSCGRELCCSTWLNDFKSVSTTAARYQNLSINQTKLSGQCGRLKCCLNYELDTYMDALRVFPENAEKIKTTQGVAYLQKKDIFRNLMWFSFEKSNTLYPLSIERVKEIIDLNKQGIFPEELQAVEIVKKSAPADKNDFVDVVGQLSLKSLDKNSKKKKKKPQSAQGNNDRTKTDGDKSAQTNAPRQQNNPNAYRQNNPQGGGTPRPNQQQGPRPQGNKGPRQPERNAGNGQEKTATQTAVPKPQANAPRQPQQQRGNQKPNPNQQRKPNPGQKPNPPKDNKPKEGGNAGEPANNG